MSDTNQCRSSTPSSYNSAVSVYDEPFWLFRVLRIENELVRKFLAEFFGTFILVFVGNSGVAQDLLYAMNNFLSINLAYTVGLM